MLTAFIKPAQRELLAVFILLAVALGMGRFLAGDGQAWNVLVSSGTAIIFAIAATKLRAVLSLNIPTRTWLGGLASTALLWSGVLAVVGTLAAVIMQRRSPYYMGYDMFLVTTGPVDWIDTNGDPYVVEGAGMNVGTVLLTFAVHLAVFLLSAMVGALIGVVRTRFGVIGAVIAIAVVLVGLASASMWIARSAWDHSATPFPVMTDFNYHYEILVTGIPGIIIAGLLTWLLARKIEP